MNSFKQFGLLGVVSRSIRKVASIMGVKYENYYLLKRSIFDYEHSINRLQQEGCELRMLTLEDFKNSYSGHNFLELSPKKMQLINKRFSEEYEAFGGFNKDDLIYASWISYSQLEMPGASINDKLNKGYALLLDDYCASHMRQRGIHGSVNVLRLNRLKEKNIKSVLVAVMCINKPALKSHIKNGFDIVFKYYTLKLFGKEYTNLQLNLTKHGCCQ